MRFGAIQDLGLRLDKTHLVVDEWSVTGERNVAGDGEFFFGMIRYGMEGENVASRHVWPASENAAREIREVAVKNTVCDSVPVECRPKPSDILFLDTGPTQTQAD